MELLAFDFLGKPIWMWASFLVIVLLMLALDLGVLHRSSREIGMRESLWISAFYVSIGLAFGIWVWQSVGAQAGAEYITGFLVEKTLALDNIFVISLVFAYFAVPPAYQHRVLFWGILGVIVLRAIMIGLGTTLVSQFSWVLYIFALFLVVTGVKMLVMSDKRPDLESNPLLGMLQRRMRITSGLSGEKFFVWGPHPATGRAVLWATPLFAALVMIEIVDLIFAIDSVPAIFAITTDPYIVYTSNIFAILGLRALYFALAAVIGRFHYLKPALALVLIFIGMKIFIADAFGWDKFPAGLSLAVTCGLIAGGILFSLRLPRAHPPAPTS